jgi:large subunit ribosomal protein L17
MRHLVRGRSLSRKPPHRLALMRNLSCQLVAHEKIVTTVAKAKELRPYIEKLITVAKRAVAAAAGKDEKAAKLVLLHARRRLIAKLGGKKTVPVKDDSINIVNKLLNDLAPRYSGRPGGYTRIAKQTYRRVGDAAPTAQISLMPAGDAPSSAKSAPAPTAK